MSPLGVSRSHGPMRPPPTAATLWFLRLTRRGKAWSMPLAGSSSANSSPMNRQPRVASNAASVDFPAPDSPVITSARPSRSTTAAWSNRCRRQPSAICRFIPISAARSACASGSGAASGSVKSPAIATCGRTKRRHGRVASNRTVKSGTSPVG